MKAEIAKSLGVDPSRIELDKNAMEKSDHVGGSHTATPHTRGHASPAPSAAATVFVFAGRLLGVVLSASACFVADGPCFVCIVDFCLRRWCTHTVTAPTSLALEDAVDHAPLTGPHIRQTKKSAALNSHLLENWKQDLHQIYAAQDRGAAVRIQRLFRKWRCRQVVRMMMQKWVRLFSSLALSSGHIRVFIIAAVGSPCSLLLQRSL